MMMFRARWYEVVHMVPFWGFLALTGVLAVLMTDSTVRFNDQPVGFDGVPIQQELRLAVFVLGMACLWFAGFAGYDEKVGTMRLCLVEPASRRQWVLAGLGCYVLVLLALVATFLLGIGVTLLAHGFVPLVTGAAVGDFAAFLMAFLVVALAYGGMLGLVVTVTRSTGATVVAVLLLLGGMVESALGALATHVGAAGLARALEPLTPFHALQMLYDGNLPSVISLLAMLVVGVLCVGLTVIVAQRRAV